MILHYKLIDGGWDPYKEWHQMEFRSRENVINFLASVSHAHRIVILKAKNPRNEL